MGGIWYGVNVLALGAWLFAKIALLVSGKASPLRRMTDRLEEACGAYSFLEGPVIHVGATRATFDRAAQRGVIWDQHVFYILDRLVEESPLLWENDLRQSGVVVLKHELSW